MKSSEEFKSEVYRRADKKQKQIKLRRRTATVVLPCAALLIISAAVLSERSFNFSARDLSPKSADGNTVLAMNNSGESENTAANGRTEQSAETDAAIDLASPAAQSGAVTEQDGQPQSVSGGSSCQKVFETVLTPALKDVETPMVLAVSSRAELDAYIAENAENFEFTQEFYDTVSRFDNSFFKGKWLIIAVVGSQDYSADYVYSGLVQNSDGTLTFKLICRDKQYGSGEQKHIFFPVSAVLYDSETKVNIEFSE